MTLSHGLLFGAPCVRLEHMRMHKKGHLEERLEACADILTVADLSDKNMKRSALVKEYICFDGIFGNANPARLEIGCGKGKFVCETAKLNPAVNFIACEKISNVLIDACERVKAENIKNVYFLNCAAEVLPRYIKPGSVETIYLNFSNPLPKEGYKKQRLTHPRFLETYRSLLKDKQAGYKITEVCEDLKNNPVAGDVETEHEKMFKERGKPIYRIVAEV